MPDKPQIISSGDYTPTYLPDFCDGEVFLRLLVVVELIAIVFALVGYGGANLYLELALISVAMLWVGLGTAALLCLLRRLDWLGSHLRATVIVFAIATAMTLLVSLASLLLGGLIRFGPTATDILFTLTRNLAISFILVGLALRYFYLRYESGLRLEVQARARLQALQARIRPHFLFNSMNTIASLTHDRPDLAEQAIENLSDLFRASLAAEASISLEQEIELTRSYIALEALRLDERLVINWRLPNPLPACHLPALTLQPLVENAIYHGIEPLPEGGAIDIDISVVAGGYRISITNPLPAGSSQHNREGNRMAVENIRERLLLAFGGAASMDHAESEASYTVRLRIPETETV